MRADRLVSMVLLLRQRGRMTASSLAAELEVSTRTVLRDIEALSTSGVPIYADRGRHGGFALLPGFRTELTGLNHDEALALLAAGTRSGEQVFGLGSALASALRKVVDALPDSDRATAGLRRLLIEPDRDLLGRTPDTDPVAEQAMIAIRRAVLHGRKLRIRYAATDQEPQWRTIDPIGLVTVRDNAYLLASKAGADRTYRLSRIIEAEELSEPADRPADVDLEQLWRDRSARFRNGGDRIVVLLRLNPLRRRELVATALTVLDEEADPDGWLTMRVAFQDVRHAVWALWQLGDGGEALAPQEIRDRIATRAAAVAARYERPVIDRT